MINPENAIEQETATIQFPVPFPPVPLVPPIPPIPPIPPSFPDMFNFHGNSYIWCQSDEFTQIDSTQIRSTG